MRAAILVETGQPLVVDDLRLPALGVGQVLVRMQYAAICGAQLGEIAATKGPDKYLPHLLGHEGVGTVVSVGAGVTTKHVGNKVVCHWRPSQGIEAKGAIYNWHGQAVNSGPMTCFSTETIVSENRLTLMPDGIDERVAPLYGCAFTTAYGVVVNDAKIKPGDKVIVFGFGGVGMAVARMAERAGARVVAMDRVAGKMDGLVEEWDGHERDFDVAIDITGASDVIEAAYQVTHKTGRIVLVGVPRHDDPIRIDSLPLHFGKQIIGSQGGWCVPHEDIPRIAKMDGFERMTAGWILHEFPLDQINEALDLVRTGTARRVLLRMDA